MEDVVSVEVKKETYIDREKKETLENALDIAYYKTQQNDEIVENTLLGEFTKDGTYTIDKKYLLGLIAVKKHIQEEFDNKYLLMGDVNADFKDLKFTLQVEKIPQESKKIAVLRFIETTTKADFETKEILKTVVARYKDEDDIYFLIKVKKAFNICLKDESLGKDVGSDEALIELLQKYNSLKALKGKRIEGLEYLAKIYLDELLSALKNNPGKFSEYVLRNYDKILVDIQTSFGKPNYYRLLKVRLDKLIDTTRLQLKDPVVEQEIQKNRQRYVEAYNAIHEKLKTPIVQAPIKKKEETKSASTSSGAKSGGKSGGSSGKKGGGKAGGKVASGAKKIQGLIEKKKAPIYTPTEPSVKLEKSEPIKTQPTKGADLDGLVETVQEITDDRCVQVLDKAMKDPTLVIGALITSVGTEAAKAEPLNQASSVIVKPERTDSHTVNLEYIQ